MAVEKCTLAELIEIRDGMRSLEKSVDEMTVNEVRRHVSSLEDTIKNARLSLTAIIDKKSDVTFAKAFIRRVEKMGISKGVLNSILRVDGVSVFGDIVTQVLLGEEWHVDHLKVIAPSACCILGANPLLAIAPFRESEVKRLAYPLGHQGWWKMSRATSSLGAKIHIYYPANGRVMSPAIVEDGVKKLMAYDFAKVAYSQHSIDVFMMDQLSMKIHSSDDLPVNGMYAHLGFKSSSMSIPNNHVRLLPTLPLSAIATHIRINVPAHEVDAQRQIVKLHGKHTFISAFECVMDYHGVTRTVSNGLIKNGLAFFEGDVVTQALFGEVWLNTDEVVVREHYPGSVPAFLIHHGYSQLSDSVFVKENDVDKTSMVTPKSTIRIKRIVPNALIPFYLNQTFYEGQFYLTDHTTLQNRMFLYADYDEPSESIRTKYESLGFTFKELDACHSIIPHSPLTDVFTK